MRCTTQGSTAGAGWGCRALARFLLVGFLLLLTLFLTPSTSIALQGRGVPVVVGLRNGARFEGEASTVGGYSMALADTNPYGQQPIVLIDDGLRRILFPLKRVLGLPVESDRDEIEFEIWHKAYEESRGYGPIVGISNFNEFGHRILTYIDPEKNKRMHVVQGITKITPRYCILKTLSIPRILREDNIAMRDWTMSVATSSIPTDVLRNLLLREMDSNKKSEHLRVVEFFLQAEQYQRALDELALVENRFVDLKDQLAGDKIAIRSAYGRQVLREARMRLASGQYKLSSDLAGVFPRGGLAQDLVAEFEDFQDEIKLSFQQVESKKKTLEAVLQQVVDGGKLDARQREMLQAFWQEIAADLSPANVNRLDSFVNLGNSNDIKPEQKLSLALSGWLLGSNNSFDNFAISRSLLSVRKLVVEYLTTADRARRALILNELASMEGSEPNYLANLVENLLPLFPPDLTKYTGEQPLEFTVEIPGTRMDPEPREFRCQAHLPPEYDPYRKYPCIVTLRPGIDNEEQLNRWCGLYNQKLGVRQGRAMRHGYIVVAVDWMTPEQRNYKHSLGEHMVVLKSLRKALRMFSIDSDRVFLAGHGAGATAAYDIGISHPEHWAGVIGFGGRMNRYVEYYKRNRFGDLPVYSVVGQKDIPAINACQTVWNEWLRSDKFADCVLVEYKGRGDEAFFEAIPEIFKWTDAQRRRLPGKAGFIVDCKILRPWDNYFWNFRVDGIPEENVVRPENWTGKVNSPLQFTVELRAEQPNRILFRSPERRGDTATIFLSPEIVDFTNNIEVLGRKGFNGSVQPSREILLEDVRRRADRKHPYWAKLFTRGKDWKVVTTYDTMEAGSN